MIQVLIFQEVTFVVIFWTIYQWCIDFLWVYYTSIRTSYKFKKYKERLLEFHREKQQAKAIRVSQRKALSKILLQAGGDAESNLFGYFYPKLMSYSQSPSFISPLLLFLEKNHYTLWKETVKKSFQDEVILLLILCEVKS